MDHYYIGLDVGTGSVRAALIAHNGELTASATRDTHTFRDPHDHRIFEQSTTDIWAAICTVVKSVLNDSNVPPSSVKGIGFDATCSLAVTDQHGHPVVVTSGDQLGQVGESNVILWADHRAEKEAELINSTNSIVLDYVGGVMSLEMEVPKILWLKKHMSPTLFSRCQFFDLPDFLTYRATSSTSRSSCSLVCKCSYVPGAGWNHEFFDAIGLTDGYKQLEGDRVLNAGMPVGNGLSKQAAEELGLVEGTPVGSAVIDAYAGWIGTIAAPYKDTLDSGEKIDVVPSLDDSRHRIASVAGTSTCHLVQSPEGVFVNGVWGPYRDVIFPGWWMNEPGQSSTGQLIEFILTTHPAYAELVKEAESRKVNIHQVLEERLEKLRVENGADSLTELTKDIHIYPDLHGNRSPIADPRMRGSISGLQLDHSLSDLALKFHATLTAIALQTRHILSSLNDNGHSIDTMHVSGGQAKNTALMRLFAEVCGVRVVLPNDSGSAVVRGAAILGRFASEVGGKGAMEEGEQRQMLWDIMVEMNPPGTLIKPGTTAKEKRLLEAKYKIFRETIEIQQRWRREMEEALGA